MVIEMISESKLRNLIGSLNLNPIYLEKDYFLTILLYLLKDVKSLYFKGGTALNKVFLNHARLSEDLDFTVKGSVVPIRKKIESILNENRNIFPSFEYDNTNRTFFRMKVYYNGPISGRSFIIVDINSKASVVLKPELHKVEHFYDIPEFSVTTLNIKEIAAEKVRALITRNQPRDYFDVYMILGKGNKIDMKLVRKKVREVDEEFSIDRIFKNANRIYSRWDDEISSLTNKPVDYHTVIRKLQKQFEYKQ